MDKKITFLFFFLLIISFSSNYSQTISAKIVDSLTQKPVPFATIQWSSNKGIITNEEGYFNLIIDSPLKPKDSIFVSCMGYETLGKTFDEFKDSIVFLSPKAIALNNVIVSNKQYTAEEIIDLVKENLDKNYNKDLTKKKIFFRERYFQNLNKTNYSKFESTITAFNSQFLDSVIRTIPKNEERYTEALFDLYGNYEKENQKINLIKASELYDKNSEMDLKALETKFNKIIKESFKI